MNATFFLISVTLLCWATFLIQVGVYYNKMMTIKDRNALDILPLVPYGVIGFWGLIIILMNGVIV